MYFSNNSSFQKLIPSKIILLVGSDAIAQVRVHLLAINTLIAVVTKIHCQTYTRRMEKQVTIK